MATEGRAARRQTPQQRRADGVIGHAMKRIPEEERKQWLLEAYRAGLVSEDEVSMFFYVFDLKEA
jgi:hypothetical protein